MADINTDSPSDDVYAGEIWLAENIEENIYIPTVEPDWHNGLAIRGIAGSLTQIKDAAQDETPIIEVEPEAGISHLELSNLKLEPNGSKTRAFTFAPEENGYTRGPSLGSLRITNCRFEAPSTIGLSFFTYCDNVSFRSMVETDYEPLNPYDVSDEITTSAGLIIGGGNQHYFNRCNFVTKTGKAKYGALWTIATATQLYNHCHFNIGTNPGTGERYNRDLNRPVGACLIDGCRDISFYQPYVEAEGDFAFVNDRLVQSKPTDGLTIKDARIHSLKIDHRVKKLVIESPQMDFELNVEDGIAQAGGYIEETGVGQVTTVGDAIRYFRVKHHQPKDWEIDTPTIPGVANERLNRNPFPVRVYQTGAEGTTIKDHWDNERTVADDSGPIVIGADESISYQTTTPSKWDWYGME